MGAVYRAHDPDLDRDVAIKLVRSDRPLDETRRRTFEAEARATAALTHPNVVTVHDAGVCECGPFLVYEILDGETLQERLRQGGLTVGKAVDYGVQLAEGLAAAHARGIVHKDLKAGNVFVTRDGRIKILDFGLADLRADEPASGEDSTDSAVTEARLKGTPGYMAPEQILGQAADARSDIFSLGVVLYEMLAGRRPFAGPGPAGALLAAVTDDAPRLARTGVSPALRAVVEHCLEKRPDERFQSARDVALALRAASATEKRRPPLPALLALAAVPAAGLAVHLLRAPSRPPPAATPAVEVVPLTSTHETSEIHPALSRDGSRIAFSWDRQDGNFDIYVRSTSAPGTQRLTSAPELDCCPAWSPDGETIAFLRVKDGGEIRTVPARGGHERLLRRTRTWFGSSLSWSPDGGSIVFSDWLAHDWRQFALFRLDLATLQPVRLTTPRPDVAGDAFGTFSPDGGQLAFARLPALTFGWADLSTVPRTGGDERVVARVEKVVGGLAWSPAGDELVYSASGFDESPRLWRLPTAGGAPRLLGEDPPLATALGAEAIAEVSRSFRLSVSPQASALAYSRTSDDTDIWRAALGDLLRSAAPLIASTRVDEAPQYAPDGRRIAFTSNRASRHSQVWVCDSSGAACEQITAMAEPCGTPRWAPTADRLVFDCAVAGVSAVFVADVETRLVERLSLEGRTEAVPSWSRDGGWIYFASDRSGQWDVWKMPVAGGTAVPVTTAGGFAALEAADGRVYYTKYASPGLFTIDPATAEERQIHPQPRCWGYWTLGASSAFVADAARADQLTLTRVPLDGTAAEVVGAVPGTWACGESGLSLAPDGRSLLYVAAARGSDVMLMRNFR
jgi:serine/threonine protein kinase